MNLNPVTTRELRERFRGGRGGVFVSVWIGFVVGVGYLIYLNARASQGGGEFFGGFSPAIFSSSLGREMFEAVSLFLLTGMLLVVPGVAALSIVGERERLTLPLLQVSQLRPRQIVLGKLASSLAYQLLLLVSVAPIMLVPILFGGVDLADMLKALAVIAGTSIVVGSLSVWISARSKTTRGAVAGAYIASFSLVLVSGLGLVAEVTLNAPSDFDRWGTSGRELYSTWINPYIVLVSAVDEPDVIVNEFFGYGSPFQTIDTLLSRRQWGSRVPTFFDEGPFGLTGVGPRDAGRPPNRGPVWVRGLLVAWLVSGLALWRASRHVTVPAPVRRSFRRRKKEPAHATA